MLILLSIVFVVGVLPLVAAVARLRPGRVASRSRPPIGSVLLAALAFNLTFFWQELWLVIPKALTPGLSPILYHNDHQWSGSAPIAELLQGTGAVATLVSGVACTALLAKRSGLSPTWKVFAFWLAFEGLFQSLSQLLVGSLIPGNDVGRALTYLGFGSAARGVVLAASVVGMGFAGRILAALVPTGLALREAPGTRAFAASVGITGVAIVLLSIVFRIPRDPVEVVMIPAIVTLIGVAWLSLGTTFVASRPFQAAPAEPAILIPATTLVALLIFFQEILRPGIRF